VIDKKAFKIKSKNRPIKILSQSFDVKIFAQELPKFFSQEMRNDKKDCENALEKKVFFLCLFATFEKPVLKMESFMVTFSAKLFNFSQTVLE